MYYEVTEKITLIQRNLYRLASLRGICGSKEELDRLVNVDRNQQFKRLRITWSIEHLSVRQLSAARVLNTEEELEVVIEGWSKNLF